MTAPAPEAGTPATDVVDPAVPAAGNTEQPPAPKEPDWKARAREWEDRAKANKKAADELAEIKKSQQTAEERAASERKELETRTAQLEAENIRYKAAALHGISEDNFDLLGTGSEEEINARALRIGELEDAALELQQLKAAQAGATAAFNAAAPVGSLAPGTPQVPDNSYPAAWFPGVRSSQVTEIKDNT